MGIEVELIKWVIMKMKRQGWEDETLRFVGSQKGKNMDLTLNVKENKGGRLLSLLCCSSTLSRGFKCICFPK